MRLVERLAAVVARRWVRLPGWWRLLVPCLWMALLWWSSSRPPDPRPGSSWWPFAHNAMHVVAWACLGAALLLAGSLGRSPRAARWWAFGLAVAYGAVDEWHQSWVPGRVSSFGDLLSDASGAALAVTLLGAAWHGDTVCRRRWPWLLPAAVASVSIATWLPW